MTIFNPSCLSSDEYAEVYLFHARTCRKSELPRLRNVFTDISCYTERLEKWNFEIIGLEEGVFLEPNIASFRFSIIKI
jgi:hypothetical protein